MQQNVNSGQALIDESAALAALDGDRSLLSDLAVMFVEDAPIVVAELRTAVQADKAVEVRRSVHSLKGLLSTFYASSARDLAERFEQDAAAQRLDALKSHGCDDLERAVVSVIDELKTRGLAH